MLATCSPVDDLVCYRPGIGSCPVAGTRASVHEVGGTDALLAARLAAGDHRALAEVFDRLAPAVYSGALRVLGHDAAAQDVVQDVFVELWSHPGRYDPAEGTLRTFLIMQARHRAMDVLRSELRRIARQERHHRLTLAATFLHVAIAISTIAIIAKGQRWPWYAAVLLGVAGVGVGATAYLGH